MSQDVNDLHMAGKLKADLFDGAIPIEPTPAEEPCQSCPPIDEDMPLEVYDQLAPICAPDEVRIARELPAAQVSDNSQAIKIALEHAQERMARGKSLAGYSTGFGELDVALDGLQLGNMYGCGGRPGMGKSIVGLNIALNVAKSGTGVYYITLEMPTRDHAMRQLFCLSGVSSTRWKQNRLRPEDWTALGDAVKQASKFPILWDEKTGLTVEQIEKRVVAAAKRIAQTEQHTLRLVVIDHAMLIRGSTGRADMRANMTHTTHELKNMAKRQDVAILALAQLNRALEQRTVKDKRPQMSDFREAGSWEEDADAMLLLFRQDYYVKDCKDWDHVLEINMPKIRGGSPSLCKLRFDGDRQRILTIERSECPSDEEYPE